MRIIPMMVGLLCTFLTIHAQKLPFTNNLRPAELVETARNTQITFKEYEQLLQPRPATAVPDDIPNAAQARVYELPDESRGAILGEAPLAWQLSIEDPEGHPLLLDLVRVDPFTDDFRITTASGREVLRVDRPLLYRGVVRGSEQRSVVALTVSSRGLTGMINYAGGRNLVLRPLETVTAARPGDIPHLLSVDTEDGSGFECQTPDSGVAYAAEELRRPAGGARSSGCVRIYFEVDYDIYQDKGGVNAAVDFVTDLWSQVATLYANDGISAAVSEIMVWDTPSPYGGSSSSTLLSQFQSTRTSFNGDLGQLLSYKASGGIAVLSGLCHPYTAARLSFSSISSGFNTVPNYSWSVMVVAHELGHLLGSQHTHACVWNGNGTAIDGCAGFTEGSCPNPGAPAGGGTLMSYCHVTSVGIDFTKGFGAQPRNVILNKINSASCLQVCSSGGSDSGTSSGSSSDGTGGESAGCDQEKIYIEIDLDNYGMETKWRVLNENSVVVAKGGPYLKEESGRTMRDTLCLAQGCYTFRIEDAHEDGLCCNYGQGSYTVRDAQGQVLAQGAEFAAAEATSFCLPYDPNGNPDGECTGIDFAAEQILSYGASQDAGQYQLLNSGQELYILNNAWKAIAMDYTITPNTVLEFEFRSTKLGEIHGIGFDDDNYISSGLTFRVYGSQYWGIGDFADYPGNGTWKSYSIPVGQYFTGTADKLFFVADHDGGTRDGNSYFRNVRIHEGDGCANLVPPLENAENPATVPVDDLRIYPNPTQGTAWLETREPVSGPGHWTIRDLTGRVVRQGETDLHTGNNRLQLDLSGLPDGSYVLQWSASDRERQTRFTVVH